MAFQNIKINKEICDPIYGYIYITNVEAEIIDTFEFQRLDRLLQTPSAHYIFPNATHTRKAHSLGVMHLANKCLKRILYRQSKKLQQKISPIYYDNFVLDEEDASLDDIDEFWSEEEFINVLQSFRIAGLCHDIGHGPFSHIFESACKGLFEKKELNWKYSKDGKFKHEKMSSKIIEDNLKDKINDGDELKRIIEILTNEDYEYKFLNQLLNSPYDVDKLDYVSRDAYHTGAIEYGNINYHRIMDGLRVLNKELLISSDSIDSVINSITATQYMYSCVYQHPTARVFDFMLYDAIMEVPNYVDSIINDVDKFIETDDHSFIMEIKRNIDESKEYAKSYEILKNVMNRKLMYKDICTEYISLDVSGDSSEKLEDIEAEIKEDFDGYNLRVDYAEIKPIRIDVEKIRGWLDSKKFYDDIGKASISLKEISRAYYEMLLKLQIIFSIYMEYDEAKKSENLGVIRKINREVKEKIDGLYEE